MVAADRVNLLFVIGNCNLVPGAAVFARYNNPSQRVDCCGMAAELIDDDRNCNIAAPVVVSLANAG